MHDAASTKKQLTTLCKASYLSQTKQMEGGTDGRTDKIGQVIAVILHLRFAARFNDEKEACMQDAAGTKTY